MTNENFIPEKYKGKEIYVFELIEKIPFYNLSSSCLTYVEEFGSNAVICNIDGANSIFENKLSEADRNRRKKAPQFVDGFLEVNKHDTRLLNYLFMHDGFNGKTIRLSKSAPVYKLQDKLSEAKDMLENKSRKYDAISKIQNAKESELLAFAALVGDSETELYSLRNSLLEYAEYKPEYVLKSFGTPYTTRRFEIKLAFDKNLIEYDSQKMFVKWSSTGNKIVEHTSSDNLLDFLTKYSLSDDGLLFHESIMNSLFNEQEESSKQEKKAGRPPKQV